MQTSPRAENARRAVAVVAFAIVGFSSCQLFSGLAALESEAGEEGAGGAGVAETSAGETTSKVSASVATDATSGMGGEGMGGGGAGGEAPPACGDGTRAPAEACDDGDLEDGDGCSSTCTFECVGTAVARNPIVGSCWVLLDVPMPWDDAQARCRDLGAGADLATPSTVDELVALRAWTTTLGPLTVLLGGTDRTGAWRWTTDDDWDFGPPYADDIWGAGGGGPEPNNSGDCLADSSVLDGLDDLDCADHRPAVCEVPFSFTSGCGDRLRRADEECDDGNTEDGDGCSADCLLECGAAGAFPFAPLGRCYWAIDAAGVHDGGEAACAAEAADARFAVLPDADAIDFVSALPLPEGCGEGCARVDARRTNTASPWTWGDGTPWDFPASGPPWAAGEPTADQHCLLLYAAGGPGAGLHSANCGTPDAPYLCETRPLEP